MKWHVMIFGDVQKTRVVKVVTLPTMKDVSYVVGESVQSVSNYFHNLIRARGALEYVCIFKG